MPRLKCDPNEIFRTVPLPRRSLTTLHVLRTLLSPPWCGRSSNFLSLLAAALASCVTCAALNATAIGSNQAVAGTTASSPRNVFNRFMDGTAGKAGQVLHVLTLNNSSEVEIVLSTCTQTDFATYLVVFAGLNLQQDAIIAESGRDPSCSLAEARAGLTFTAISDNSYTILVTGAGEQEGAYTLTVSAREPQPILLPWGLDRIDQRYLPLDHRFQVTQVAGDTPFMVYILDSGVRSTHVELRGRVVAGYDGTGSSTNTDDCTGSGTSIASIVAGQTVGVARIAHIVPVKILNCTNEGRMSAVLNAIEWVLLQYLSSPTGVSPSAILMRYTVSKSTALDRAIQSAVGYGIPVIVPAGDRGSGSFCDSVSPYDSGRALVVGSTNSDDAISEFSNFGPCVGLYAPGRDIFTASHVSDTSYYNESGTAQAAAYVAGVTVILMTLNPGITPGQVTTVLTTLATRTVRKFANGTAAQSNRGIVFIRSVPEFPRLRPPVGFILIYFVLRLIAFQNSTTSTCAWESVNTRMAKVLKTNTKMLTTECFAPADVASSGAFLLRLLGSQPQSLETFQNIDQALYLDSARTAHEIGSSLEVLEPVWFADSNGIIFWGEPQVGAIASDRLSPSVVAGIVIGAVLLVVILIAISFALYRFLTKKDEVEAMEGSGDVASRPPAFDDFGKTTSPGNMSPTLHGRSFRNVIEGLSRSMSLRKVAPQSNDDDNPRDSSRARMDSFASVGGDKALRVLEDTRMHSYGGEAFFGPGRVSQSPHQPSEKSPRRPSAIISIATHFGPEHEEHRLVSFRGSGNVTNVTRNSVYNGEETPSSRGDFRLHSIDGEAFSVLARESGNLKSGRQLVQKSVLPMENTLPRSVSSATPEGLAPGFEKFDSRQLSFFHDPKTDR